MSPLLHQMNGNEMHGGEYYALLLVQFVLMSNLNIKFYFGFWEVKVGAPFCALKFILVLHDFRFSLEGNVWLSASQEDKLSLRLFLTPDPAGHI